MKRANFYRRDPAQALAGMVGMSLEERGVYNTLLDLFYLTWRPVEDERRYIAGHCGCAVQKLNPIIDRLVARGKLIRFEEDGRPYLTNARFEEERSAVRGAPATASGRAKVGQKSAGVEEKSASVREKSAGVEENPPTCRDESAENQSVTALDKIRVDKSRDTLPNGSGAKAPFDEFSEALLEPDPKRRSWLLATLLLTRRGGKGEVAARGFFGKMLRDAGLTAEAAWPMLEAAWRSGTSDPAGYMTGWLRNQPPAAGGFGITDPDPDRQRRWARTFAETGEWRPEWGAWPGEPGCRVADEILAEFGLLPASTPAPERISA